VVEEAASDDWGIGGNAMTLAEVHALARGKAVWRRVLALRRIAPGPSTVVRAFPFSGSPWPHPMSRSVIN